MTTENPSTKEKVYDDRIHPLMAQVIQICKENQIPFVGSFSLGEEPEGNEVDGEDVGGHAVMCTTAVWEKDWFAKDSTFQRFTAAKGMIVEGFVGLMSTRCVAGGGK